MNTACCYCCISKRYLETVLQNMTLNSECILLLTKSIPLSTLNPKKTISVLSTHLSAGLSPLCTQACRHSALSWRPRKEGSKKKRKRKRWRSQWWSGVSAPLQGTGCGFSRFCSCCASVPVHWLHFWASHTHLSTRHPLRVEISVTVLLLTFWYRDVEVSESRIKTFTVTNKVSFNLLK